MPKFRLLSSIMMFSLGLIFSWELVPDSTEPLGGHFSFSTAQANDGEGDGGGDGGDNAEDQTIVLNKTVYTKKDMENAVKQVDAKKDVKITGTSSFLGTKHFFSNQFLQLSRYMPNFASKLLNAWLGANSFAKKYKLVKKARKNITFLQKLVNPKKDPVRAKMLSDAMTVITDFEKSAKQQARDEASAKRNPGSEVFRSDISLKKNIKLLATLSNGLNIYTYSYLWSTRKHVGVMAQEVRKIMPRAVKRIDGWLSVDYGLLFSAPAIRRELEAKGLRHPVWTMPVMEPDSH